MIYLYHLMLSGLLLLSQAGSQRQIIKVIKAQEFLVVLSNFTEATPGLKEEEGSEAKENEEKQKLDSDAKKRSNEGSTTIYFYKKISGELQL